MKATSSFLPALAATTTATNRMKSSVESYVATTALRLSVFVIGLIVASSTITHKAHAQDYKPLPKPLSKPLPAMNNTGSNDQKTAASTTATLLSSTAATAAAAATSATQSPQTNSQSNPQTNLQTGSQTSSQPTFPDASSANRVPVLFDNVLYASISWDEGGSIYTYSPSLESQLNILPEFPALTNPRGLLLDAELLRTPEGGAVVKMHQYRTDLDKEETIGIPLTNEEAFRLRRRISQGIESDLTVFSTPSFFGNPIRQQSEIYMHEQQIPNYILGSTLSGMSFGLFFGLASISSRNTSSEHIILGALGGGLLYGGAAYWVTQQPWFTLTTAYVVSNSLNGSGLFHGLALVGLASDVNNSISLPAVLGTVVGTTLLEAAVKARLPETLGMNFGQTVLTEQMSGFGFFNGVLLGATFGIFDQLNNNSLRAASIAALLGTAGGTVLGYTLSKQQYFSGGDASVMSLPASLSIFLPIGTAVALSDPNPNQIGDGKLLSGLTVLASAAGFALGAELIRNKDFSLQQAQEIASSTSWGMLAGWLPITINSPFSRGNTSSVFRLSALLPVVGGGVGFLLSYIAQSAEAAKNHRDRVARRGEQSLLWHGAQGEQDDQDDQDETSGTERSLHQTIRHGMRTIMRNTETQVSSLGVVSALGALGVFGASTVLNSFSGLMTVNPASGLAQPVSLPIANLRYTFGKSEQEDELEQKNFVSKAMQSER
jgi:hypothetical protein